MEQYSNSGQATLSNGGSSLTSGATTVPFTSGVNVPSAGTFRILIDSEIMEVTAVSGGNMTVTRADGGTSAASHADGSTIFIIVTKESLDALVNVQSEGTEVSNRRALNFLYGANVADNSGSTRADITILGNKYGAAASLPAQAAAGRVYIPSDGVLTRVDTGSVWGGRNCGPILTVPPVLSNWTWVNQGGATAADIPGGGIYLASTVASGDSNRMLVRSATPPYTIIAGIKSINFGYSFIFAGICVYDSVGGKIIIYGLYANASGHIAVRQYNSVTSWNSDAISLNTNSMPDLIWLKIVDDGTNRTYNVSQDGVNWYQIRTEVHTTWIASPTSVGIVVQSNNGTAPGLLSLLSWSGA